MEEQEEKKKQERRKRSANGERSGKMMSFRCDYDVMNILSEVTNKGRLLNDLVRRWDFRRRHHLKDDPDEPEPERPEELEP